MDILDIINMFLEVINANPLIAQLWPIVLFSIFKCICDTLVHLSNVIIILIYIILSTKFDLPPIQLKGRAIVLKAIDCLIKRK